jgi:hypothetical protein
MTTTAVGGTHPISLRTIHILLAIQSIVIIFGSINRLTTLTTGYVAPNEFLRWVDLLNMLAIPLASLIAFWLLKKHLESAGGANAGTRASLFFSLMFIVGAYILGASYGDHEVTNYLHTRFCADDTTSDLCRIIIFNDDEFSHWLFFVGFAISNAAMLFIQALFPLSQRLTRRDLILLGINALFIGAGIFANLAFEVIGFDLYIVAGLAALSVYLLWRRGAQPLFVYYSVAYVVGLIATFAYKLMSG